MEVSFKEYRCSIAGNWSPLKIEGERKYIKKETNDSKALPEIALSREKKSVKNKISSSKF